MITLKAKPDCKHCRGAGVVADWVPYGIGNCRMDSDCECAFDDCTDQELEMITRGEEYEILPAKNR